MVAPIDPQTEANHRAGTAFNMMMHRFFDEHQAPWVLMEWIHNVEVAFRFCHVRHQLHVDLATMRLRGHALIWWLSMPKRHILNCPQILEMLRDEFELPPYEATVE
ncbi:hypothetical protein TIFTF001_042142 [Ficus carica]|uniref:Retrotransposon gag domain-containing protein n=1 Tax=Ficus carica TaxID=3494 RepID=A0AA88CU29_FICCA|nr:hypothetical protein TIFTF001_042141 [Ficus carica]GMN34958.1 hypothetical protein TIFTF001_042142 [Ficus carica]